ncbi:uncharacterized protein LOC121416154 [Lytechinus variegatus]|uniref:uncharacterized protein LOC121416154 n=1 Tax=Lytechinus variegatus TaxID=7654 RepID=UPI001BB18DF1|nr:uncharacterized protein LOC121416154 [Lytechinus variegatus]
MDEKHTTTILIFLLMAVNFSETVKTFSGITELILPQSSNLNITKDFVDHLDASLENILSGVVDDVIVSPIHSTEANPMMVSFLAHFEDFEIIPACLSRGVFYYTSGMSSFSYTIRNVSLQNFRNNFHHECFDNKYNVAYFEYVEEDCKFETLACELDFDINRISRYEINKGGSVLYNFYCISVDYADGDCVVVDEWLKLEWDHRNYSNCLINQNVIISSRPDFEFIDDIELQETSRIDIFPILLSCLDLSISPPIIPISGDQTWDKLPNWLKVCLRILNGISLCTLLFCLLTFAMFKELRNAHSKNVLCLVVATLLSLFYTSGYIPLQTDNPGLCVLIATLIYFFVLVPNYWWTAVAIFLAWTLGRKGIHRMEEISGTRFFTLLSLFGWGLPLIFSLIPIFLFMRGIKVYDIDEYCWITNGWPILVLTAQSFIPFLIDCILFGLVIYRLRETRHNLASMDSTGKNRRIADRQLTIKMMAIFGVFWLPSWIFFVAFLIHPISSLAIIAQVLNQLSTFILPIVLCCNKRVAALWKAKLAPLRDRLSSSTNSTTIDSRNATKKHTANDKPFIPSDNTPRDHRNVELHEMQT